MYKKNVRVPYHSPDYYKNIPQCQHILLLKFLKTVNNPNQVSQDKIIYKHPKPYTLSKFHESLNHSPDSCRAH